MQQVSAHEELEVSLAGLNVKALSTQKNSHRLKVDKEGANEPIHQVESRQHFWRQMKLFPREQTVANIQIEAEKGMQWSAMWQNSEFLAPAKRVDLAFLRMHSLQYNM